MPTTGRGGAHGPAVVALGGGHGLAASLSALRLMSDRLTAIVTVADDGGSSGRLREEMGVLPPGDLRMALSALCDDTEWGRLWRDVLQHRFTTGGPMDHHAVGNLLIVALWELLEDPVQGLDWVGRLLGARGRVLPMASVPLEIEADILVTLDEVLHGSTRTIHLQRADPRTGQSVTQTLRVKIPPGVREAQLIRLAGKGLEVMGGGESGNLYLRVKLAQHPDFRVRGADLYYDLDLAPWEAVLGATVDIPTLDGTVSLKIPAGTVAEQQLRLRGKGLPTSNGTRGDLYAVVSIQVPAHLTPEQKVLWGQLATKSTFNPRQSS